MPPQKKAGKNPHTMVYFKDDKRIQNDEAFFGFIKHLLSRHRSCFKIFAKSVSFASQQDKRKYRKIFTADGTASLVKRCACISSFFEETQHNVNDLHVAVVEGLSYPPKGAQVVRSQYFEFHSCVVIVDPTRKRIWIFNPWRIGDRPRILNRVKDVQPNLVQRLVAMYRKRYTVYYRGGNQYSSSDCRYKVLKFVKKMSEVQHYAQLNGWVHLPH